MTSTTRYEETWSPPWVPLVFFLPCFYCYGVRIDDNDLLFGYGFTGPGAWTAKRVALKDIDKDSITTGTATWKDNLMQFGGWGIRRGRILGTMGWVYNAANGPYVDIRLKDGSSYRFATRNPHEVKSMLVGSSSKED